MDFDSRFGDKITHCELAIAHTFKDKILCVEALNAAADTAACYYGDDRSIRRKLPKNNRLAVYGDRVAEAALCRRWYTEGYESGAIQSPPKTMVPEHWF
ncbi:hypothetical protein ED733_000167 [Metarhizium rileyi]|uniref:Uncharacterized protein n=1 Tax=Metarhizium rileyi (strain RCEF 4871) TaxID=1649241 RepID=A0A5C6FY26_METRR|nr:hypothetical protein ED733_000167 [Metarhizium rileyi]